MGIKGVYQELGPGRRVALSKLAVDTLEKTGRQLRLAIDVSIWQFQVQAAKGGTNPAIRTLFYRLVRLQQLGIRAIFVFDGPHKPVFKRNKRSNRGDHGVANAMAKRLIQLFGFPCHDAPGEAEAECALLQRHGLVDAVLSEDVDTLMFGSTKTLRNWSAEGQRGNKTPTHVSLYDIEELQTATSGLDREGMVLVALMSGGDYLPEGVPGCGPKLACEAARAGFGRTLCRIKRADAEGLRRWKELFAHELRTNESRHFRTRHHALVLPDSFPNFEVLRHYTHPVVSDASDILKLESNHIWTKDVDVAGLRAFVRETFDWTGRMGSIKFIKVLAPALLSQQLLAGGIHSARDARSELIAEPAERLIIKRISGRRLHSSTDGTPELRISYVPADIVGVAVEDDVDQGKANFGRNGLALNSDDEGDEGAILLDPSDDGGAKRKVFDPEASESLWISEAIAKLGAPLTVKNWEDAQREKSKSKSLGKAPRAKSRKGGPASGQPGPLDTWLQATQSNRSFTQAASSKTILPQSKTIALRLHPESQAISVRPSSTIMRSKQPKSPRAAATGNTAPISPNSRTLSGSPTLPRTTAAKPRAIPETIVIPSSPLCSSPSPPRTRLNEADQLLTPPRRFTTPPPLPSLPRVEVRLAKVSPSRSVAGKESAPQTLRTPGGLKDSLRQTCVDTYFGSITKKGKRPKNQPSQPGPRRQVDRHQGGDEIAIKKSDAIATCVDFISDPLASKPKPARPLGSGSGAIPSKDLGDASITRAFQPRKSLVGYFEEIEGFEEAELPSNPMSTASSKGALRVGQGRDLRPTSRVSIIDLTADDD